MSHPPTALPAPLLQVRQLVKKFGGLLATDHATFDVRAGELHALIGPNGAGKTTLIHQLSGALAPSAGAIAFAGQSVAHWPLHRRARAGLVRSYQITSIFKRLSVWDNLALALQARPSAGSSFWFWQVARSEHARWQQAAQVAERVGLGERLLADAGSLSHGEQRQLEVGLALALEPQLLLLDEPLAGMGPEEAQRMVALLQQLKTHTTVLLVEHDMDAVFRLADRVSVLVAGRVVATGTPEEIRANAQVQSAYLGEDDAPPPAAAAAGVATAAPEALSVGASA